MSFFRYSYSQYSAKFLTGLRRFLLLNCFKNGLVVDGKARISEKESMQGLICLGSTGYGKSTVFSACNLMTIKNASMVVIDPSKELYNLTHRYLRKYFDVKCIDLIEPKKSDRWQVLYTAKTKEDMTMIADAIISASFPQETAGSRFFNQSAKNLIAVLLTSVLNRPEQKNLGYIYAMLNRYNKNDKAELTKELSKYLDAETWLEYKAIMSQPERLVGNVIATCRTALAPMTTETLKKISSGHDIHIASLRTKPTVLFINIAENRFKEFGLFVSLLLREITETFSVMPKKNDLTQYLLLDEAGNFYFHKLANFLTICRKRRVSVSLILQSMRQLRALYNDDADTIIENTKHHIYFPGLSLESCEQISKKIGYIYGDFDNTFLPTNKKRGRKYPLVSPEAIRTLKNGFGLLLSGNKQIALLKFTPWYKNFWLRMRLK
ncbi:MAG: type IV secretion system DNA-binding domain-containing protein [Flavobacteriaceae bacterium]|nr:MAG: type IV secretion system DNA-binding domain-containing protein [Flavobacteriaceae bacterium]